MKVLLIGATGYIGGVLLEHLRSAGHEVEALLRGPRPLPPGVGVRHGDLGRPETMSADLVDGVDAVVHAGAPVGDWDAELASVRPLLAGLRSFRGSFLYLSGTWVLGPSRAGGEVLDEFSPARPIELVAGRERMEELVLGTCACRGAVVRPGLVHGRGGGIPGLLVQWARQAGVGRYVAAGDPPTWPMVHVDDLAALVGRVLLSARGGHLLHAVAEPAVPVVEVAAAADVAAGGAGRAEPWPAAEAAGVLGRPFADALAASQRVRGLEAPAFGWRPSELGVLDDLRDGSYVGVAALSRP